MFMIKLIVICLWFQPICNLFILGDSEEPCSGFGMSLIVLTLKAILTLKYLRRRIDQFWSHCSSSQSKQSLLFLCRFCLLLLRVAFIKGARSPPSLLADTMVGDPRFSYEITWLTVWVELFYKQWGDISCENQKKNIEKRRKKKEERK